MTVFFQSVAVAASWPAAMLTVVPVSPLVISNTTPLGTTIANIYVRMSDGSTSFSGSLAFGPPNGDDGGRFAIVGSPPGPFQLIINPSGPGVGADGTTIQKINVIAA